jgi:type IV pilus modification protein PilV
MKAVPNKCELATLVEEKAFSIIEVLIAIAILAVGMLAIGRLQVATVRNTTIGNATTQAVMLAHQKMEEVKSQPDVDSMFSEVEANLDEKGDPGGIYTRTTTITTPPAPLDDKVRQVQVQVQWNAAHGGNRTVTINSVARGRGI